MRTDGRFDPLTLLAEVACLTVGIAALIRLEFRRPLRAVDRDAQDRYYRYVLAVTGVHPEAPRKG